MHVVYSAMSLSRCASANELNFGGSTARPGGSTGGAELARGDMGCSGARVDILCEFGGGCGK